MASGVSSSTDTSATLAQYFKAAADAGEHLIGLGELLNSLPTVSFSDILNRGVTREDMGAFVSVLQSAGILKEDEGSDEAVYLVLKEKGNVDEAVGLAKGSSLGNNTVAFETLKKVYQKTIKEKQHILACRMFYALVEQSKELKQECDLSECFSPLHTLWKEGGVSADAEKEIKSMQEKVRDYHIDRAGFVGFQKAFLELYKEEKKEEEATTWGSWFGL